MSNRSTATFKFDSILGIVMLVGFFVGLFLILKGIFTVLSTVWVALGLLAVTLIIDRYVVINYVKWLWNLLRTRPLYGIAGILFTVIGYMVVIPFLFAKALFKKKIKNMTKQFQGFPGQEQQKSEFVDYEEISSETKTEEPLELPKIEKKTRTEQHRGSDYEQFFE